MGELKTNREYQERFLDGFDRSRLRQEVQKVRPTSSSRLRKKYATWALGASLALGGLGVPLKMAADHTASRATTPEQAVEPMQNEINQDASTARSIAQQVASGVAAVGHGVEAAATTIQQPLTDATNAASTAPQVALSASETVKQQFFKKEVPFGDIIYSEARKNNVAPELVAAVVNTESKFVPTARSGRGAIGLMQLVPKTGRWMGARDLTNPAQNISAGTKYLRYLSDRFGGDQQKMVAAYNAGEGNVRRFNGVPPFKETQNYVSRVRDFQRDLGDRLTGASAVQVAEAR
jgi:soluble lytic murein transglycosylase-like protein